MQKLSKFIIKQKKWILIATCAIVLASIVGTVFLIVGGKINSNMLEYLPRDAKSTEGISFLKQNFNIEGDAFVVVEGVDDDKDLALSIAKIKREVEGITQFVWYNDVLLIEKLMTSGIIPSQNINIKTDEIKDYLRQPIYNQDQIVGYNYVLLVLFDYSPSSFEAFNVHKQIYQELSNNLGRSVAISGMTALADTVMKSTMKEVPYYLIFSVLTVIVILLLASQSFVEPFVLIITLGVSILVNMGSNIVLPQVSIISFAASSVLQLGITMDYAIFLLHTYREERLLFDAKTAASNALPRTFISIIASALTTIGGFGALYFMRFTIGIDIANVIIKGVLLSLVTVIFLQPCLMIIFDKAMLKTRKKRLNINFAAVTKKTLKVRHVIVILAILLVVPAFLVQKNVNFSYLKIYNPPKTVTSQQQLAEKLGNQVIIAVPLDTKQGTHQEFMLDMMEDKKISNILGAYTVLDMEIEQIKDLLNLPIVSQLPPIKMLFSKVDDSYYTMYLASVEGDTEDKDAFATYHHLMERLNYYFDESYPLGVLTGVGDMAAITMQDFLRVSIISAIIIFIIMSLLLKSSIKSAIMVLLIELAVWINISINVLLNIPINFMIYIIISSIQLGCTVDYAILLNTRFSEALKRNNDTQTAVIEATKSAFSPITVSASIIIGVCMSVFFVSSNLLVKEMASMMARGAFVSYILVMFVLPCILSCFKGAKSKGPKNKCDKTEVCIDTEKV